MTAAEQPLSQSQERTGVDGSKKPTLAGCDLDPGSTSERPRQLELFCLPQENKLQNQKVNSNFAWEEEIGVSSREQGPAINAACKGVRVAGGREKGRIKILDT